ncbi:MAG: AAA family ATPase [Gemmatimonadota bacterium]
MASVMEADRRIVSVLFADLSGFTPLTEELDAETVRDLIAGCLGPLCDCVTRCGGFVDKFIGDCVMALFGAPVAYENEEERAIHAALDMHRALAEWAAGRTGDPWAGAYQPRLSIGINTGPVVTGLFSGGGAHNYTAVGDAVNVAARLQGLCEPGRVLVGPTTYWLTEHVFEFEEEAVLHVKGRHEPVRARYVRGVRKQRGQLRGVSGAPTPLAGRTEELRAIRERWELARAGRAQICLLVGPAGIGKTRLVEELVAEEGLGDAQLVRGRSYPHARSTPWEPLAELIRELYGVSPQTDPGDAVGQISKAVGGRWGADEKASLAAILGGPATDAVRGADERQERAATVLRRVLSWKGPAPRLLVLEDLHWADGSTLAFLSRLSASDLSGPALLVLVTRPPVAGEQRVAALLDSIPDRIDLSPLSGEETRALMDGILGNHALTLEAIGTLVTRSDGMPLFVEEMLKALIAGGSLQRDDDGVWVASGDWTLAVPDTVESVLSTRIDALPPSTKRALQFAATVGRRFWPGVLSDGLEGAPVEGEMETLREAAFVREQPGSLIPDEREHWFEHLMLQEVAYNGLLRSSREELHGSVGRWLEEHLEHPSAETDDLIAYHYERSKTPRLALPFLERGIKAAMSSGGLEDARTHVDRALEICGGGEERGRLLLEAERLAELAGDSEGRLAIIASLEEIGQEASDSELVAEVLLRKAGAAFDRGDLAETRSAGREALSRFEALEDVSKQGDALRLLGREAHQRGDHSPADALYESALEMERQAGDRWGEAEILDLRGMLQVDRDEYEAAVASFDLVIEICHEIDDSLLEARVRAHRAAALRWMGCLEEAEATALLAVERATGSPRTTATCQLALGGILADAGRPEEARSLLRRSLRAAVRMNRPALEAEAWLELAWLAEGAEAMQSAREAELAATRAELVHVEILALARMAELHLEDGNPEEAARASAKAMEGLGRHGSIVGPEERLLLVRGRALAASADTAGAEEVFDELRSLVTGRAAHILDPARKASYLGRCEEMANHAGMSMERAAPTAGGEA